MVLSTRFVVVLHTIFVVLGKVIQMNHLDATMIY